MVKTLTTNNNNVLNDDVIKPVYFSSVLVYLHKIRSNANKIFIPFFYPAFN